MTLQLLDGLDHILRVTETTLIREEIDVLCKDFDLFKALSPKLTEENDYKFYSADLEIPGSWNFNQYLKHLIKAGGKGGRWILKSISQEVKKAKTDKLFEKADATVLEFLSLEFADEFKTLFANYQGKDHKPIDILKNWVSQAHDTDGQKAPPTATAKEQTAEQLKQYEIEIWQLAIRQLAQKNMLPISDTAVEYAARCLRKTFPKAVKESFRKHLTKGTYHHLDRGLSGQLTLLTQHLLKFDDLRSQLAETTFWQLQKMGDRILKRTLLWSDPKVFDAFSIQETKRLAKESEDLLHKIKSYSRQAQSKELRQSVSTDSSLQNMLDFVGRPLPTKAPTFGSSSVKPNGSSDSGNFEFDSDVCLVAASEQGQIPPGQIVYPPPTMVKEALNHASDVSPIVEPVTIEDHKNNPHFATTEMIDFRNIPQDVAKNIQQKTADSISSSDTSDGQQDKTHLIIDQPAITATTTQSATYKPASITLDSKSNNSPLKIPESLDELQNTYVPFSSDNDELEQRIPLRRANAEKSTEEKYTGEKHTEEKSIEELLAESMEQRQEYMEQLSRIKQEAKQLDRQISQQLRAKAVEQIYQGEFAQAEKTLAQAEHYRAFKSQTRLIAARIAIYRGNLGIAQNIYDQLLEQADNPDDIRIECICGLAELFRLAGDIQGATNYLASLELDYEQMDDCSAKFEFLKESGYLSLMSAECDQAEIYFEVAKKTARALELQNLVADISRSLGEVYLARKETNRANSPVELAMNYHAEFNSKLGMAADYLTLASIELEKQDMPKMQKFLISAEQQLQGIDAPLVWANYQKLSGELYLQQRAYDQAQDFFTQAQTHYQEVGCHVEAGYILARLAALEAMRENWDAAWELLNQASVAYEEVGAVDSLIKLLNERSENYLRQLEFEKFQINSWLWMSLLTKYERFAELAAAHELNCKVHKQTGDIASSRAELEAAMEIYQQMNDSEEAERIEFLLSKIDPSHAT